LERENGRFLKKSAQKLLLFCARGDESGTAQINKSFLLLFFKKEGPLFCLRGPMTARGFIVFRRPASRLSRRQLFPLLNRP
jgi:hypothetical protein